MQHTGREAVHFTDQETNRGIDRLRTIQAVRLLIIRAGHLRHLKVALCH
jgi:hypothetical protein